MILVSGPEGQGASRERQAIVDSAREFFIVNEDATHLPRVPAKRYSFAHMDWSGEWWVVILGAGLVFIVAGTLYLTRSRAFTFRSAAAQLGFIDLQGLNPFSDEEKKGMNLFSRGSDGKTTNMFGDRVASPSLAADVAGATMLPTPSVKRHVPEEYAASCRRSRRPEDGNSRFSRLLHRV